MNFKLRILVILLIALGLPFIGVSAVHAVVEEEEVTEDESTEIEDADPESNLSERKKKKKNLSNNENGFPKHVHTVKGADDDVVLYLDSE